MLGPSLLRSSWLPNSSPDLWLSGAEPSIVLFEEVKQPKGQCQRGGLIQIFTRRTLPKRHTCTTILNYCEVAKTGSTKRTFGGGNIRSLTSPPFQTSSGSGFRLRQTNENLVKMVEQMHGTIALPKLGTELKKKTEYFSCSVSCEPNLHEPDHRTSQHGDKDPNPSVAIMHTHSDYL